MTNDDTYRPGERLKMKMSQEVTKIDRKAGSKTSGIDKKYGCERFCRDGNILKNYIWRNTTRQCSHGNDIQYI